MRVHATVVNGIGHCGLRLLLAQCAEAGESLVILDAGHLSVPQRQFLADELARCVTYPPGGRRTELCRLSVRLEEDGDGFSPVLRTYRQACHDVTGKTRCDKKEVQRRIPAGGSEAGESAKCGHPDGSGRRFSSEKVRV